MHFTGSVAYLAISLMVLVITNRSGATMTNLTSITWAHAVNSQRLLTETLASNKEMIEADIVMGTLNNDTTTTLPVMGHPPANTSDLSLESFLHQILEYNAKNASNRRGIKLDFKSIEVFLNSEPILTQVWSNITTSKCPIWLNADILSGPVNNTETVPVDPQRFINSSKNLDTSVLSLGWTTKWGADYREGTYSTAQVNAMVNAIKSNNVTGDKHNITFPVRAGIAANSANELGELYTSFNASHNVTFTIWSSEGDYVDVKKLRDFILKFGVEKVYVDVPEDLYRQLDLSSGAASMRGSLVRILNIALVGFATIFGIYGFV